MIQVDKNWVRYDTVNEAGDPVSYLLTRGTDFKVVWIRKKDCLGTPYWDNKCDAYPVNLLAAMISELPEGVYKKEEKDAKR